MYAQIYEEVLPTSTRVTDFERIRPFDLSLLHICRSICIETVPMLYGKCLFSFDLALKGGFARLLTRIEQLPRDAIASIRKLNVHSAVQHYCVCSPKTHNRKSIDVFFDRDSGKEGKVEARGGCPGEGGPAELASVVLKRIYDSCAERAVRKEDLMQLLEIVRPTNISRRRPARRRVK